MRSSLAGTQLCLSTPCIGFKGFNLSSQRLSLMVSFNSMYWIHVITTWSSWFGTSSFNSMYWILHGEGRATKGIRLPPFNSMYWILHYGGCLPSLSCYNHLFLFRFLLCPSYFVLEAPPMRGVAGKEFKLYLMYSLAW